jgi:acyl-[acyl-carrier-protein]-phospholipid O-acyltransferase/long-chain-fatty-acid--[acyl-carrier-protein] ligase
MTGAAWQQQLEQAGDIGQRWIAACKRGGNPEILVDTTGTRLESLRALTASVLLARQFRRFSTVQNIGLLLPSTAGSALANMACMLLGKTAVNLNFTASTETLVASAELAEITTIFTSRRFLEKLQARGMDTAALGARFQLVPLEQLASANSTLRKLMTYAACRLLPAALIRLLWCKPVDLSRTAVILFSSGSEGIPKGVMLSQRAILSNVKQIAHLLNFRDDDVVLANLPPFHAFGLTVTHFLPLLERVKVVCHPDPTEVVGAAMAIEEHKVTTMFGTSSFYRLYNRNNRVQPQMLDSVRLAIAGAEKLQEEVRDEFLAKFGKDILEGYGATETAPVASVNIPDFLVPDDWRASTGNKRGSVGMPLPETTFRVVDPDTFATLPPFEAGMILISGPQLMDGYYRNEAKTSTALRIIDGLRWYVSGDKGYLDGEGFLYIQDRYSRFAKIGGEMVGLGAIEKALREVVNQPEFETVVVNLPDARKGERLVALVTLVVDARAMREGLILNGLNTLAFPAQYYLVGEIPKLGSGKTDFATARKLAHELSCTPT